MIRLRVDEAAAIPLAVESASPVSMTVKEEFIDRGGASIQSNKTATPGTAAVVVTPDPGYDAMAKVTVEAVPQGALSPIDINFDDSTGAFTAEARVGTSGYIPDTAFVGGGFQLSTQAAATITPTTVQQQAVAAHKYTTGAVVVDPIPSEYIIPSGTKNITSNGNAQDVKSYEKVNVSVPNSYAAADEGKVVQSGALVSQSSQTINENGTYDTTLKNEVVVNVSGGGSDLKDIIEGTATSITNNDATSVRSNGFQNYTALQSISLPNVTTIKPNAFQQCSGLTSAYFPNLTTLNGSEQFRSCTNLQVVALPKLTSTMAYTYRYCSKLTTADLYAPSAINAMVFDSCPLFDTLILRKTSGVVSLGNVNVFGGTKFKNGGAGGTIYIPKVLYDHLGDGSNLDYKAATNWSTINGYGTITWAKIEGSIYENAYADGTPIT